MLLPPTPFGPILAPTNPHINPQLKPIPISIKTLIANTQLSPIFPNPNFPISPLNPPSTFRPHSFTTHLTPIQPIKPLLTFNFIIQDQLGNFPKSARTLIYNFFNFLPNKFGFPLPSSNHKKKTIRHTQFHLH